MKVDVIRLFNIASFSSKCLFYIPFMVIRLCAYGGGTIDQVARVLAAIRSMVCLCRELLLLVVGLSKKQSRKGRIVSEAFSYRACKWLICKVITLLRGSSMEWDTLPPLKAHTANHQTSPYVPQNIWAKNQFPKCEASA